MGIVALVSSFVPVIGDFAAAPAGILAVVLGSVGIRRCEKETASNFGESLTGAVLGAVAVLVIVLMFAVTA